jgi:NADH-quinone oxidoreductase subunit F
MPAYEEEIESAIEEGIEMQFLVLPVKVLTHEGKVVGVECVRMELGEEDESGRRRPIPIEGSEFSVELDALILAIGERPDVSFITEHDKLEVSKWETIIADKENLSTSRKGIFVGGDIFTGPSTVAEAIAAGKKAADSIEKYVEKKSLKQEYKLTRPSIYVEPIELTEQEIEEASRPEMPRLSVKERQKNFREVNLCLSAETAIREAKRCLRCELETEDGKKALGRSK